MGEYRFFGRVAELAPALVQTILLFIALIVGREAWRAWRCGPVTSLNGDFQPAEVFLLTMAAMLALVVEILGIPSGHTPSTRVALLPVPLVLTGFIAVVFRFIGGKRAQLPKGAPICEMHRLRLFPWIHRTSVSLVLVSAATLLVPSDWIAIPMTLGGVVLLLATTLLFPLYLRASRFDDGMTALMADPWIHWHYRPEEWQAWAAIQRSWERARTPVFCWKRDCPKLLFPIAIIALATWIPGIVGPAKKAGLFLACVSILLTAGLPSWTARRELEGRYRRMLAARPEAYLGDRGFYCSGEYWPWIFSGHYLAEAAAVLDPPSRLILNFDSIQGNATRRLARLIPIPEGRERELDLLQQRLRLCCPKATVHLVTKVAPLV